MRRNILIIFITCFCLYSHSQERFFNLYPGWTMNNIYEDYNYYYAFGLDTINQGYENTPLTNIVNLDGSISETYRYISDSITGFSIYTSKSYSIHANYVVSSGVYKEYFKSYVLSPILMYLNRENYDIDSIVEFKDFFDDRSTTIIFHIEKENEIHLFGRTVYSSDWNIRAFFGKYDKNSSEFEMMDYEKPNNCQMTPYAAISTADGGYIISTEQDEKYYYPQEVHACLLKIDSEGNEQWRYVIPGQEYYNDIFGDVEAATYRPRVFNAPDGNYWVVWTDPFIITDMLLQNNIYSSIRIAKLIDNGESCSLIEERSLMIELDNPTDFAYGIIKDSYQDENGNIYLLLQNYWGLFSALAKVHFNGVGAWLKTYKCYPENSAEYSFTKLNGISRTSDNGFMLCGEYQSDPGDLFPSGIQSSLIIKTDSCGCFDEAGCNDHCMDTYSEYYIFMEEANVYPNPAKDIITVSFDFEGNSDTEFEYRIYTADGKQVLNGTFQTCDLNVDICNLLSGYYTIQIWGGGKIFTGKFVKE